MLPSLALAGQIKARSPYVVKGDHPVPSRWQRVDRAPADHPIELRIGVKSSQFEELERQLYEGMRPLQMVVRKLTIQSPIQNILSMGSICLQTL